MTNWHMINELESLRATVDSGKNKEAIQQIDNILKILKYLEVKDD